MGFDTCALPYLSSRGAVAVPWLTETVGARLHSPLHPRKVFRKFLPVSALLLPT